MLQLNQRSIRALEQREGQDISTDECKMVKELGLLASSEVFPRTWVTNKA
jgi:hypothetical protein